MALTSVVLTLSLLIAAPQDAGAQDAVAAPLPAATATNAAATNAAATSADLDALPLGQAPDPQPEASDETHANLDAHANPDAHANIHFDGSGIRLSTPDGRYYVRLGGYGQFLYQQTDDSSGVGYQNGFRIRRARTTLRFGFGDFSRLDLELNLRSSGVVVHTAAATIAPIDGIAFRVGMQKALLNPEQLHSSRRMAFLNRSYLSELTPQRDLGLSVALTPIDALSLELGMYNGADGGEANKSFKNNKPEFQARLQFSPTALANLGASTASLWLGVATSHGVARDADKQAHLADANPNVSRQLSLATNGGLRMNLLRPDAFYDGPRTRVTAFAYGSVGGLRMTAEFLYTQMDLHTTGPTTLGTRSWNIVAGYSFGGEASPSGVTPKRSVEEGGLGALELKARYHEVLLWNMGSGVAPLLQVDPGGSERARIRGASAGLSWWASPYIHLQADYHFTKLPDNARAPSSLPGDEHTLHFGATIGL